MAEQLTIRKICTFVEEAYIDNSKNLGMPYIKAAAAAVLKNPYAGKYQEDLSLLYDFGAELGKILAEAVVKALNIKPEDAAGSIESYGKGIIVGLNGELEHAHAIMHPKFGAPFRAALGGAGLCKAIMPSTAKQAVAGTCIDIPLHCKTAEWVITHFDTITINVPDSPWVDEIMVAVGVGCKGRPQPRIIGLRLSEVK